MCGQIIKLGVKRIRKLVIKIEENYQQLNYQKYMHINVDIYDKKRFSLELA